MSVAFSANMSVPKKSWYIGKRGLVIMQLLRAAQLMRKLRV